jgi:hypothetical protein
VGSFSAADREREERDLGEEGLRLVLELLGPLDELLQWMRLSSPAVVSSMIASDEPEEVLRLFPFRFFLEGSLELLTDDDELFKLTFSSCDVIIKISLSTEAVSEPRFSLAIDSVLVSSVSVLLPLDTIGDTEPEAALGDENESGCVFGDFTDTIRFKMRDFGVSIKGAEACFLRNSSFETALFKSFFRLPIGSSSKLKVWEEAGSTMKLWFFKDEKAQSYNLQCLGRNVQLRIRFHS